MSDPGVCVCVFFLMVMWPLTYPDHSHTLLTGRSNPTRHRHPSKAFMEDWDWDSILITSHSSATDETLNDLCHTFEREVKKKKHSCFFLASMVIKASVIYSEFHLRTGSITFLGLLDFVCWSFSCISSIISSWWFSYSSSLFIPSLHFPSSFQSFL